MIFLRIISQECGISEGIIGDWIKEEHKHRSFVDTIQNELGLQRKNTKLGADRNYVNVYTCSF